MKQTIKKFLVMVADAVLRLRGLRFPDYVAPRHRLDLLLFGNEQDVARLMKRRLRTGMCVLDVGANVGLISRICARAVGASGKVIAFEPDPYTRGFLEFNVSRYPTVSISPIALSDDNCTSLLHIHPESGTSNSLLDFAESENAVEVECMTLDSFLESHPELRPDCIKIDVEGAEPKVLVGMRETIKRYPELFVVIEFCPSNLANGGCSPHDYFSLLTSLGLRMAFIRKDGTTVSVSSLDELLGMLGKEIYCNLMCHSGV